MPIPTIKEILQQKGVKFGNDVAGGKKFEVPANFFNATPIPMSQREPVIEKRYQPSSTFSPRQQTIEQPIVQSTPIPTIQDQQKNLGTKILDRMATGQDLANVYGGLKTAAKGLGVATGAVGAVGGGLVGGLIGYTAESIKQSKDFLSGKTNYWDTQKKIWNETIDSAKDTAQFGYGSVSKATEIIPDMPVLPFYMVFNSAKGIADTFSETGTVYEQYKNKGVSDPGLRATYDNLVKGSQEGWKLVGVDEKTAKDLSQNSLLAGMGNLILYGGAYLGARGVAKEVQWATSKLPILEMKPTGNKVLMSEETFNSIKNNPNFKTILANSKVEVIEGGGQRVAITFNDLQKIKPENIQALINQGKQVPGFLELKEFERTPWGTLQSAIEKVNKKAIISPLKLTTPKFAYTGQIGSNLPLEQTQIIDNLKLKPELIKSRLRDAAGQVDNAILGKQSFDSTKPITPLAQKVINLDIKNIDSPGKFYTEVVKVVKADTTIDAVTKAKILGTWAEGGSPTGLMATVNDIFSDLKVTDPRMMGTFNLAKPNRLSPYTQAIETQPVGSPTLPIKSSGAIIPIPTGGILKSTTQLKGVSNLLDKLKVSLEKKQTGRVTASDVSGINNLKSIISNLENTVATNERNQVPEQISEQAIINQPQGAQPAKISTNPTVRTNITQKSEPIIVQGNEVKIPQVTGEIQTPQQIIQQVTPNEFIVNSVDERTLKPDGNQYVIKLSTTNGRITFDKYIIGANGERNLIYKIPATKLYQRYGTKDPGYIAQRMVNPTMSIQRVQHTIKIKSKQETRQITNLQKIKAGQVVYYKGEPYTVQQSWANNEGVGYSYLQNNNTRKLITVKDSELTSEPQAVKVDTLYSESINGRLKVDKNGNINLSTEKPEGANEIIKLDTSKLKVFEFKSANELYDAVSHKNKEKYTRMGYDLLKYDNHVIAINPRTFATKVGQKTIEPGRQHIGALIKRATLSKPVGRPQVAESQAKLEAQGLKAKAELKQAEKDALERQRRLIEQERKAQQEAERARQLEVKQELEEIKRTGASKVVVRKLTPEEITKLVKSEPKFISKKEKEIIEKSIQKEEQISRISNTRKTINDKEYKAKLTDLKNKGKDKEYFLNLYKEEAAKESSIVEQGLITKSDVILDFLEDQYGFSTIKAILQPIKLIERGLNTGWEKGLRFIWKEIGAQNFSNALKEKLKLIPFTNSIGKKFVYNYGLPEWYKDLKQEVKSKEVQTGDMARNVMNNLSKGLTEEQKVELHGAIINFGHSENPDIEARAKFAREILDTLGEEYWKSGAIDRSVYERNKGQYLPRLYYGQEMAQPLLQFVRSGGYKANLARAKKRGIEKLVSSDTLDEWIAKGWEDRGDASNGRVRIWRDYTVEERKKMGEIINEPGYLVAKGIQQVGYDTAVLNLFKNVSVHPEVVSNEPIGEFKQLPDQKEYGALKGKYIDQYLYNDIKGIVEARQTANSIGRQMLSEWKRFKVVDNPATHFRNMYFNFILSDIAGLSPARVDIYGSALKDIINKQGDYKEAHDLGLFGTEWVGNELQALISDKKILNLKPGKDDIDNYNWTQELGDNVFTLISKMKNVYDKVQGKLGDVYQAEEHLNKLGLYKFAKYDLNLSPKESLKFAEKWGLNYSAITPFIKNYGSGGKWYSAPFVVFPVLSAPRLVEGVLFRPFTILKLVAIFLLLEKFSKKVLDISDEKLKQIKTKLFPGWMQTGLYVLTPVLDKNGNPQFLDMTYIIPFIQDIKDPINQLSNYVFGNPIVKVPFEIILNRSAFTMNDIVNKTLYPDLMSQLPFYTQYIYQQLMPPIMPGNYNFNKLWDAIKQKPDYAGRINDVFGSISTTIFGLKLRSLDLSNEKKWRLIELKQNDSEYAKKIMSLKNDKSLTDQEKKKEIDRLVNMRKENMQKALEINRANQPEVEPYTNFFLDK